MVKKAKTRKKLAKAKESNELNARQLAFCREYLKDHNQTQAAIRAGYSENGARQKGSNLMAKANIKGKIAEIQEAIWDSDIMTHKEALARLSLMGRSELGMVLDDSGNICPKKIRRAGQAVRDYEESVFTDKDGNETLTRKVKLADAKGAIVELAKQLGWKIEQADDDEEKGAVNVYIQNNYNKNIQNNFNDK